MRPAYPTLGYAGWSMFANAKNKDLSWKLIAALDGPEGNIAWNKRTGALPIYKAAEHDPFYASEQFKGWFAELGDKDVVPLVMPTYLPGFAYFADSVAVKTSQQALLGQITPEAMNKQWADVPDQGQAERSWPSSDDAERHPRRHPPATRPFSVPLRGREWRKRGYQHRRPTHDGTRHSERAGRPAHAVAALRASDRALPLLRAGPDPDRGHHAGAAGRRPLLRVPRPDAARSR